MVSEGLRPAARSATIGAALVQILSGADADFGHLDLARFAADKWFRSQVEMELCERNIISGAFFCSCCWTPANMKRLTVGCRIKIIFQFLMFYVWLIVLSLRLMVCWAWSVVAPASATRKPIRAVKHCQLNHNLYSVVLF